MIAAPEKCLDQATLRDLLAGRLPTERFTRALEHVEHCPDCTELAETYCDPLQLSWLAGVAESNPAAAFEHESECQALVGNLLVQPLSNRRSHTQPHTQPPTETLGPYRLLSWLGSGGMGAVYLAEHERLKRRVAIKLLPRDKLLRSGWLERFNREMTSIAALEHPHVVRALDAGDEDDWHYLVMEHLDGLDLSRVCRRVPEVSVAAACEVVRQAALGLEAIHAAGMIHRDIKPSNLFLTRDGQIKLLDLGLVLSGDSPLTADERLTTVGHLMGTLPYMAREQLVDASRVDHRADLYSLGATLYRMLAGHPPYGSGENFVQTIQAISTIACPSLASRRSDLPSELVQLVDGMLHHDPEQRPQSAQQTAELLEPFCELQAARELIKVAVKSPAAPEEVATAVSQTGLQSALKLQIGSPPFNRKWPWILALALLPLAFAAGIVLTMLTDTGTLVIETEEPGVTVEVTQGDELVEQLQVEQTGPKQFKLRSGRYTLALDGIDSQELLLSENELAITRGDKQLVRITHKTNNSTASSNISVSDSDLPQTVNTAPNARLFQGQRFAHWMQVLAHERDMTTLGQAMQAVSMLAESEEDKLVAAKQCLLPARELGGFVVGNREDKSNSSARFMVELLEWYPRFYPDAGFEAIADEVEMGTPQSFEACVFLLTILTSRSWAQSAEETNLEYFKVVAKSQTGRELLERLDRGLATRIDALQSESVELADISNTTASHKRIAENLAIDCRIRICQALEVDLKSQPQIVTWAKRKLQAAQAIIDSGEKPSGFGGMAQELGVNFAAASPFYAQLAMSIALALEDSDYDVTPVVLGLLQPSDASTKPSPEALFSRISEKHAQLTALAIQKLFERAIDIGQGTGIRDGLMGRTLKLSDELQTLASQVYVSNHPDPIEAILPIVRCLENNSLPPGFSQAVIEQMVERLLVRLVLETDEDKDPQAAAKFAYAACLFRSRTLPTNNAREVLTRFLMRFRTPLENNGEMHWDIDHSLKTFIGKFDDQAIRDFWTDRRFSSLISQPPIVFLQHPADTIAAIQTELEQGNELSAYYCAVLFSIMHNSVDERYNSSDNVETNALLAPLQAGYREYLSSDAGKSDLSRLGAAVTKAISRGLKDHIPMSLHSVAPLISCRLQIAELVGEKLALDATAAAAVRDFVRREILRTKESKNFRSELSAQTLLALGEMDGFAAVPLDGLLRLGWSTDRLTDEGQRLVDAMCAARPEEFREFFVRQLEELRDNYSVERLSNQFERMANIYRQDPQAQSFWHAIVAKLAENQNARERGRATLQRLIDLNSDDLQMAMPLQVLNELLE